MTTAPDGSIIRRETPRPDLLAFEVRAKITKPDIEWMAAIADEGMNSHETIDMLIVMSNYAGSESEAKSDDYAKSVQKRSVSHIRRYVVVGAPMLARAMITLSGLFMPVETKTFALEDEKDAWAYLAQDA